MFSTTLKFYCILFAFVIGSMSPACARFHGLYAGAHLGAMILKGEHKYTNASPKEGKVVLGDMSYIVGLQGGYMNYLMDSRIVIGAELGISMPGLNTSKDLKIEGGALEGKVNIRHRYKFGLALFGGMVLNPKVMIYVKIGLESNKFDLNYSRLTFQTPSFEKYSVSVRGLVPGIGVYYKIGPKLFIGGEYNYSIMKKLQPRSDTVPLNGAARGYVFSPIQHRVVARIMRVF